MKTIVTPVTNTNNLTTGVRNTAGFSSNNFGTVQSFSAGNLPPLFNTSVSLPNSTPVLSFTALTQNANLLFAGPGSGSAAAPSFRALVAADFAVLVLPIAAINATGTPSSTTYLRGDGTWATLPTNGTVTSVGLALPSILTVSGSPVTASGTLTAVLATQSANVIFSGPSSGPAAVPTFRSLVNADFANTLTPTFSALTLGSGSLTGGSLGLTLNAGGSNQSIFLMPSGTGNVSALNASPPANSKFTIGTGATPITTSPTVLIMDPSNAQIVLRDVNHEMVFGSTESGGGQIFFGSITNDPVIFRINNSERMRLKGGLLIGIQTDLVTLPGSYGLIQIGQTATNSSGTSVSSFIGITYNQTGSAGSTDFLINRTETAIGSGTHQLIDAQVAGVSKFTADHSGNVNASGNFSTTVAGKTLLVKSGTNAKAGTFTLAAGTVTVSNTSVDANSVIVVTLKTLGGTRSGNPDIVPTAGTGFIATGGGSDTSTYNYVILEVN